MTRGYIWYGFRIPIVTTYWQLTVANCPSINLWYEKIDSKKAMYVASPAFATWTGAEGPEGGGFDPIGPCYFFSTMMKPTWGWFIDAC